MSLRRDALWTAFDTFATAGLSFVFRLLVAKVLAPHEYGVAAIPLAAIAIIQVFSDFGLTAALIQRDKEKLTQSFIDTTFVTSVAVTLLMAAVTAALVAPLMASLSGEPRTEAMMWVLTLVLLPAPFSSIASALLYRERRFRLIAIVRVLANITALGAAATLLWIAPSAWVVVWQAVIGALLSALVLAWKANWTVSLGWSANEFRKLFGFSGFVLANDVAVAASANAGVLVLARLLSVADAGLFSLASFLTDSVRRTLMSILNRVTFVHYSAAQRDLDRVRRIYLNTLTWNCRAVFPIMVAMMLVGPDVFEMLLGGAWSDMDWTLRWLCISVLIHTAGGTTSTLYKAIGKPGLDMALFLASTLLVLFPGMIVGAMLWGLPGVAFATAVTKLTSMIVRQWLLEQLVGQTIKSASAIVGRALLLIAPIICAWGLRYLFPTSIWLDLALISAGMATYALFERRAMWSLLSARAQSEGSA